VVVAPRAVSVTDRDGKEVTIGRLGIRKQGQGIFTLIKSEGMLDAPIKGAFATAKMGTVIIDSIVMTVRGEISSKNIGGPIQIISESGKAASAGLISYLLFMALISVNLGLLNLLPIPVLDGGHLLFMGIEAVTGRPLSDRAMMVAQRIGITLLGALMVFAMYNDLFRLFGR
jgi:regulator of sigma E protease